MAVGALETLPRPIEKYPHSLCIFRRTKVLQFLLGQRRVKKAKVHESEWLTIYGNSDQPHSNHPHPIECAPAKPIPRRQAPKEHEIG